MIQRNRFVYMKENVFESTKLSSFLRNLFFDPISKKCFFELKKLFSECCYYVSLDSNFRQTTSNDFHNKLYHYDGIFSQLFPIVLVCSLKWYFFSRYVIHLAIKFLPVYEVGKILKHFYSIDEETQIYFTITYTKVSYIIFRIFSILTAKNIQPARNNYH